MTRRLGTIRTARELPDGPLDPPEERGECEPDYAPPWDRLAEAVASIDVGLMSAEHDTDRSDRAREWRAETVEGIADECDALAADLRETARRMRG